MYPFVFLQTEVVRKVATSFFCLLVFLSVCKVFPVERNIDDDFIANTPFYAQVVYLYLSMLTTRPKYYFVWTLGECQEPGSRYIWFLLNIYSFCFGVIQNSSSLYALPQRTPSTTQLASALMATMKTALHAGTWSQTWGSLTSRFYIHSFVSHNNL